jgi:hypothetical protein
MALPKDQLNAVDRSIIDNLNAQSENIKNQSKILHKLSDEILNQRRQFSSNKSSNAQMQKEMFKLGSGISDIKNYLMGASKSKSTVGDPKNQGTDRRFFTNLFTKVFGPSRYQQQMLDELSIMRTLAERQARSLEYIAEQSGDNKRARDRESLAEDIARRMSMLDLGGGGGNMKGIFSSVLSGFGKILLAGLVGAISLLSASLVNSIKQVFNVIKELGGSLRELLSFFRRFPFGPGGGIPAGGVPGGGNRSGGVIGIPPVNQPEPGRSGGGMSPNDPNRRLPGPNQRLLAPPDQRGAPFDPNYKSRFPWNESKYGPRVMDAENVRSSGAGRFPRFTPGGGRGALYAFLASLGLAGYLGTQEGETFADDGLEKALKNSEIEKLKAQKAGGISKEQGLVDKITNKGFKDSDLINDPENPTGLITVRQLKQRMRDKLSTEEEKKKFDEDLKVAEEKRVEALEKELKWMQEGTESQIDFNKILEKTNQQLDKFGDFLEETFKFDSKEFIEFLNNLGAIQIQGQKVNLLPGLGDASQKTLADTVKLSEELGDYVKDKVMPPTIINNNSGNVIDNSTKGQSSGGFVPFRIAPTDQDILNRLKMSK